MTVVCARCAATEAEHPLGYCPDVAEVDPKDGSVRVEEGETRVFQAAENGEWDDAAVEGHRVEEGVGALVDRMVVVPASGEVVDLSNPAEVARALEAVETIAAQAAEAKRLLNGALVRYSTDVAVSRTFTIPGAGKFERTGGPRTEYERPDEIRRELLALGIPAERVAEIVVETVDRKVNGTEANKAAKASPAVEEVLARHRRKIDAPYRVTRKG